MNKIFLSFLILFSVEKNSAQVKDEPLKIKVAIDSLTNKQTVSPLLFGYSTENIFTEIQNTTDSSFVNAVKQMNPQVLRFPGGMLSNFYHSSENGYGLKKNEIAGLYLQLAQQLETQGVFAQQMKTNHPFVQDFLAMVKSTGAKVLITANILTGTPEELVDQINFFHDNNVEIAGVELGDELYLNFYRTVFPYPGSYISKSESFVSLVKKYFPETKIGACAAPNARLSDLEGTSAAEFGYFKAWNDALSKSHFYDAIIIHSYTPVSILENQPVDSIFRRALSEAEKTFAKSGVMVQALDYYREVFPKSKIWITEWNTALRSTKNYFLNTLFQAMYIGSYCNFINQFNSTQKNAVELMSFQSMATGGIYNHYGAIDLKSEKEKSVTGRIMKRTAWYAFKNLYPVYTGNWCYRKINLQPDSRLNLFAYTDTLSRELIISWVNSSGHELKIDSCLLDSLSLTNIKCTVTSLSGGLHQSFGWTRFSRNSYNTPPTEKSEEVFLKDYIFPEHGMGLIKMKLE